MRNSLKPVPQGLAQFVNQQSIKQLARRASCFIDIPAAHKKNISSQKVMAAQDFF